jgi:hypothetical protein
MGKHKRNQNDPLQKARDFDERNEYYTYKGKKAEQQRQENMYGVKQSSSSGDGDGCAIIGLALLSGLGMLGYAAARAKGLA